MQNGRFSVTHEGIERFFSSTMCSKSQFVGLLACPPDRSGLATYCPVIILGIFAAVGTHQLFPICTVYPFADALTSQRYSDAIRTAKDYDGCGSVIRQVREAFCTLDYRRASSSAPSAAGIHIFSRRHVDAHASLSGRLSPYNLPSPPLLLLLPPPATLTWF